MKTNAVFTINSITQWLKNPPIEYRPLSFWSWNDKLDNQKLCFEIKEMARAGLGGFFMHPRGGHGESPYMGAGWKEAVATCINQAKELGISAWGYDDDAWPSGYAGGAIPAMGDEYHTRWVEAEWQTHYPSGDEKNIVGIYSKDPVSKMFVNTDAGAPYLVIKIKTNPYYIDTLNEKVMKAFVDHTYAWYYKHFGDEFGKTFPGFFSDEPQFALFNIPWSAALPLKFTARNGYSVYEAIPAMFVEYHGCEKHRYDFWSVVSEMFVTAYAKTIFDWCEAHNCKFTGHVILEDSIYEAMSGTAGSMSFYEYMQMPGVDILSRHISSPVQPRQVSSVARQLGKKHIISEMYALCGWDVSFEELKWMAEWHFVNGISVVCQHLMSYTLRGARKRDYPPSLFYHQPWWPEYRNFNDYLARLSMLLTDGVECADLLVLHPIKSGWVHFTHSLAETHIYDQVNNRFIKAVSEKDPNLAVKKLDLDFEKITAVLSDNHIGYHYGDETLLHKYGSVVNGGLQVGLCNYKAVVIPSMSNIDRNTVRLLLDFAEAGGKIASFGVFPFMIEGKHDPILNLLSAKTLSVKDERSLLHFLKDCSRVCIQYNGGEIADIHSMRRNCEKFELIYLVNHSINAFYKAQISVKTALGNPLLYNALTNEVNSVLYSREGENIVFSLDFAPMQSYAVILNDNEFTPPKETQTKKLVPIRDHGKWRIQCSEENALTLDTCRYKLENDEWHAGIPVIKLMQKLVQKRYNGIVEMEFGFKIADSIDIASIGPVYLVLEKASGCSVTVNRRAVNTVCGWWKDTSFDKIEISPLLRNGENKVNVSLHFYQEDHVYDILFGKEVLEVEINRLTYTTELESIYIIGDFGVFSESKYSFAEKKGMITSGGFFISKKPDQVDEGEIVSQGFCFYAGNSMLKRTITFTEDVILNGVILDLGRVDAVATRVFVNGHDLGLIPWAPYQIDISRYIKTGANEIGIMLYGSNRNLLGPHHYIYGQNTNVAPHSFTDYEGWRESYCFVRFGL